MKKTKNNFKTLSVALLAGTIILGAPAFAQDSHAELDSASINANENDRLRIESGVTRYNTEDGLVIPALSPTLGDNSAYALKETVTPDDNSIKLYEINNEIKSVEYTDTNGQVQTYKYNTITPVEKYYNLNYTSNVILDENGSTNNRKTNINDISADIEHFVNNYSSNKGGAILLNNSTAESGNTIIKGDFINNSAVINGGAAANLRNSVITNLNGDFINNNANSTGGAIYNEGKIGSVNANFIDNFSGSFESTGTNYGSAIHNIGEIQNIEGDFINNHSVLQNTNCNGGAISNYLNGTINNIKGNFVGNYVQSNNQALGGAIFNYSSLIGDIKGNFVGNYAKSTRTYGGAIYLDRNNSSIGDLKGDFIGNHADGETRAWGGAIDNQGVKMGDIVGNFIGNYATTTKGGASGGALMLLGATKIESITGDFINNYVENGDMGGAIRIECNSELPIGNISGSFIGNHVKGTSELAGGGAIHTASGIKISANNSISLFSGNYVEGQNGKIPNAITVRTDYFDFTPTITLNSENNGLIQFDDQIDGHEINDGGQRDKLITREVQYNLHLTGDETSNIVLNNEVRNANISVDEVNVTIKNAQDFNFAKGDGINSLTINSGNLNFLNMGSQALNLQSLNLNGGTINIANSQLDLLNGTMGRLSADEYGNNNNTTINVQNLTVSKDMKNGVNDVELPFADKSFAKNVNYTGSRDLYSKILKYHTWYNPTSGSFSVRRIGGVGGYNPSVLTSSVAAQTGAYVSQTAAFNQAFSHADGFMNNSNNIRYALSHPNSYAINTNNLLYANNETTDKSIWVQPYASFESISLKNGPKVDTTSYGTFVGGNGELKQLTNGWSTITTAYVGYNGSSQSYNGINVYQNGGMLGATQTWYKGNFYTALTANVGASVGEANTPYGHDNFTMLMAGVASKTGYNLEYKEGKFIIQPSMLIGYSFINTFDYTSAAGVKISQDPLNSIQLRPNVKFISNLKNGWQPYASVGVVWNILNDTKASAEDVTLPEMSIKPYVEYGLGIQKRWKDRFTGYAQAMLRNGGRNGIALTAGFKWILGKEVKPIEKVEGVNKTKTGCHAELDTGFINANKMDRLRVEHGVTQGCHPELDSGSLTVRKVVKQLTPDQKTAHKQQNTTRTTAKAIIKQL